MTKLVFTSDWHLGHANVLRMGKGRPFGDVEAMAERFVEEANRVARPDDRLFILGDISYRCGFERVRPYVEALRCRHKHLVYGNHDLALRNAWAESGLFESCQDYLEVNPKGYGYRGRRKDDYETMEIEKIYFDMDGVLADFERGLAELCGLPPSPQDERTEAQDDEMWSAIRDVGHFYDKLEPMPGALEMFARLRKRFGERCEILTGIPKERRGIKTAGGDKVRWMHRLLGDDVVVNVTYAERKGEFCEGPQSILIDDLKRNVDAWREAGGSGVLFRDCAQAMREVDAIEGYLRGQGTRPKA